MKTKLAFILSALICHTALAAEPPRTTTENRPPRQPVSDESHSFDFDDGTSLGRALRILADLAHLNYIEPELEPKETIALSLKGMNAREAFFELARVRGFTVKEQSGVVELIRTGAPVRGNLITRRYVLRNIDARLVIQPVADFLGIKLVQPGTNSPAFPASQAQDNLGSGNGGSSGMSNTGSSSSNGNGYGNLSGGNDIIYAPLLGFEEVGQLYAYHVRLACIALLQRNPVGPDLPDLLKRIYLEEPARKRAAAMYTAANPEFKEKQIHQKVEITGINILDTRKLNDRSGKSYETVAVRAEGNLIRTGTLNKLEFREPLKFQIEFLFIRNPDLLGNGRLPLVVQDFKYQETPL